MNDGIEHRIFRQSQKNMKSDKVNFEPFMSIYQNYYNIYSDYLTNLLINLIQYKNAPTTLNQQGLEYMLREFGYANIVAVDKENIFVEGIGYDYPGVNVPLGSVIGGVSGTDDTSPVNSLLHGKSAKVLTRMNSEDVKPPVYVTMANKFSFYMGTQVSDTDLIDRTAMTLAEIKASIIANIRQQKTPFIGFTKDANLTSKRIWKNLQDGAPFIQVDSDVFADDIKKVITTMPVQTPNLAPTLQDSWNNTLNEFLSMVGINNANIDKKERLVASETEANDAQVDSSLNIYIKARQSQLDLLNDCLGTNIKAEVNKGSIEELENFARTGTGQLSGDDSNVSDVQ